MLYDSPIVAIWSSFTPNYKNYKREKGKTKEKYKQDRKRSRSERLTLLVGEAEAEIISLLGLFFSLLALQDDF